MDNAFEVVEYINGGTDWYPVAAFASESDADEYAQYRNERDGSEWGFGVHAISMQNDPGVWGFAPAGV